MSYPRDIDEIPEEELRNELKRRKEQRDRGLCDYCGRAPSSPTCRFRNRHHEFLQRRIRDSSTGWEGTIGEFAKRSANQIREAVFPPDPDPFNDAPERYDLNE